MSLALCCAFVSSAVLAVSPDNEELEKIVVTASGTAQMLKEAPASIENRHPISFKTLMPRVVGRRGLLFA